jgi:RNA polymerase sigma factor (TIGR02999 family)
MRGERDAHTLQTTALVNEAFLRLLGGPPVVWESRTHFFAVASTAMRRILVDYARNRDADKRGGEWQRVDLEEPAVVGRDDLAQVIAIDQALTRLASFDPRQARIVELRFFVGLTEEEIAEQLQLSPRTVKRDWRVARAWLQAELAGATESDRTGSV